MERHEATFEIHSASDAYAVNILMERVYDSLREESMVIEGNTEVPNNRLEAFKDIRAHTRQKNPGRLTIVFENTKENYSE